MITYLEQGPVELAELTRLYQAVGWRAYTVDPAKMARLLPGSLYYLIARSDDQLVGCLRAVGDDASILYIQDILVDPAFQRRGIGRELIRRTLERFGHIRQVVLITDDQPVTRAFYQSVGLSPIEQTGGACFVRYQAGV